MSYLSTMRKLLFITIKKTLNWPHSKPLLIRTAHRLGVYEITKKIYVFLMPTINMNSVDLDPSHLATRELMEEVQKELKNTDSNHSVVFLSKS